MIVLSPTCDNCRRSQLTPRGNRTDKRCEYDCAQEDEGWKHWPNSASGKGQLTKQTPTPPLQTPRITPPASAEAKEVQQGMICWPAAFSTEPLFTFGYPTTPDTPGSSYDNTQIQYLNNLCPSFRAQEDANMGYMSFHGLAASANSYSLFPGNYVSDHMLFHPNQTSMPRQMYERQQTMMEPYLPADCIYIQESTGHAPLAPLEPLQTRLSKLPDHQLRFTWT
ncbi:hypothetical protein RhiLY_05467 [Ceratobasidium sp. AG-Ba]|nr:hypothetical protein RhiLY_05467 [Ceratobasidium sp. AG-Ba]